MGSRAHTRLQTPEQQGQIPGTLARLWGNRDSSEPIEDLDHALEPIQEYWDENHPNEPTPKITSHYIKTSWEPMEVSSTPCTATAIPDDVWEPYDDEEYDCSSSEQDYFPTSDDELLWHRDMDEIDYED